MHQPDDHQPIHPLLILNNSPSTSPHDFPSNDQPSTSLPTSSTHYPSHLSTAIDKTNCLVSSHSSLNQSHRANSSTSSLTTVATDALLFQNLRAHAQELGLDSESLGWAIIQSIHHPQPAGQGLGTYASLIESLIALGHSNDLLLILPKEKMPSDQYLTPEIFFHHVLLTTPSQRGTIPSNFLTEHYLCNLNGWKGLMESDRLVFTAPGRPIPLNQIHDIDLRSILSQVKPSTSISNELTSPSQLRFPIYNLLSPPFKTITIPRLNSGQPSRGSAAQRLASLFTSKSESEPLTICVAVSDRALDSVQLDQSISRAISSRITDGLGSLEESMLQIIQSFIARFSVYYHHPTSLSHSNTYTHGPLHFASKEEIASAMQEMYKQIDYELEREYQEEIGAGGNEEEKRMIIDHTLELIEEVVCLELYDRLFEVNAEDEKLSEKIAQLNVLDITLDHLGLDLDRREMDDPETISTIRAGLDDIIKAASVELSKLHDSECRSPRDKVSVCVTVHKLIVDGLSSLPSIPMRKEGIPTTVSSKQPSQDGTSSNEVEMSNTIDRTAIVTDSSTMDRTLPMPPPLRPIEKNKPSESDLLDAIHTNLIDPPATRSTTDDEDLGQRTPKPQISKANNPPRPKSSSADLILPILIYLIIKANPNRLESNLSYANRFRNEKLIRGETDYCLVNFSVSCEFIKTFEGLVGSDLAQMSNTTFQPVRPGERDSGNGINLAQRESGGSTTYGTFGSNIRLNKDKNGNMTEVEDAFKAASRAVGGVLMEGYQKVLSSTLLDAPAAKLGLANGPRSGPRTLEDVKKLIGSGSAGRRSEGNMNSWSDRVGLIRRNLTNNEPRLPPQQSCISTLDGTGRVSSSSTSSTALNGSNAVKRISSLFQNNNSPASMGHHLPSSHPVFQTDDDRVTLGQRLSSLPGLGRFSHHQSPSTFKETLSNHLTERGSQTDENSILAGSIDNASLSVCSEGPIERLERCTSSDNLLISDIPVLMADYQRLCKIGRQAGLWT